MVVSMLVSMLVNFPNFPGNDHFTWHFQWRGERPQPVHFPISVPFYDALGKLGGSCPPLPSVGGLPFISSTILLAAVGFMTLEFSFSDEERGEHNPTLILVTVPGLPGLWSIPYIGHVGSQPWPALFAVIGHDGLRCLRASPESQFCIMMPPMIWTCLVIRIVFLHEFWAFPCVGSGHLTLFLKWKITQDYNIL